jgi:cytochrome bd-type quinol oxidase subunit 2
VGDNGGVSDFERVSSVKVRRAPRYFRFMLVGLVVGLVVALVLTFAFPEQDDFNRLQVFGFTAIFLAALFVAIGAVIAIAIDRSSSRRARTVAAEHEEHDAPPPSDQIEFVQLPKD